MKKEKEKVRGPISKWVDSYPTMTLVQLLLPVYGIRTLLTGNLLAPLSTLFVSWDPP